MVTDITSNRRKELMYFCKQLHEWEELYSLSLLNLNAMGLKSGHKGSGITDPTYTAAANSAVYKIKIDAVNRAARDAGKQWKNYILQAVVEDCKYEDLVDPPFTKQQYKDMVKLFYILLDQRKK